jgi:hypothetical protein
MSITERAAQVLQQIDAALALAEKATKGPWIAEDSWVGKDNSAVATTCHYAHDADAAFIATSRTLLPASLRCLKTAIEGLLAAREWNEQTGEEFMPSYAAESLAAICDTWDAGR